MTVDYKKSISSFIKKLVEDMEFYPEKYKININKILTSQQKKDLDKQIHLYTSKIAYNPTDASVYYNRGLAYHRKTDYKSAIEDFSKAIELDKN